MDVAVISLLNEDGTYWHLLLDIYRAPVSAANIVLLSCVYVLLRKFIKATPTIVEEAFIFLPLNFFCHAPIQPRDDVAEPRQKYISG